MINLYDSNITDILPQALKSDVRTQALGFALSKANKRLIDYSKNTMVFAAIDTAPEEVIDLLAIELKTQYYDTSLDISVKRNLVKQTLVWYKNAGTTKTVDELIATVFGSGEIIEWWEDNSDPYTFKIRTEAPITGDEVEQFSKMIAQVINIRSHLTAIEFLRNINGNCYISGGQRAYTINKDIKEGGI